MITRFVESAVRTNNLKCSRCNQKINKGDRAIFELENTMINPMRAVYGECCSHLYDHKLDDDFPSFEKCKI